MKKIIEKKNTDYSILFEHLKKVQQEKDYTLMQGTMLTIDELQDPIEKLRQIVMDKDDCFYNTITTSF